MMRPMPVLFALVFLPAGVGAQEIDCTAPMTQMEMTACAGQDWQDADAELNQTYSKAMAAMKEMDSYLGDAPHLVGAADALRTAQRAWIPYRDAACDAYGFLARGGTMEPMLVAQCRADLTRQRTKELNDLVSGLVN